MDRIQKVSARLTAILCALAGIATLCVALGQKPPSPSQLADQNSGKVVPEFTR